MTLANFKFWLKLFGLVLLLIFYGAGSFILGKYLSDDKQRVKGSSTFIDENKIEKPLPFSDVQSSEIIASSVKFCSNSIAGFVLSYPKNWFTTFNEDSKKCTYLAPYSFIIPVVNDSDFVPIKVEAIDPNDWEGTVKYYQNPNDYQNVISIQNLEMNGRPAQKIVASSTGQGQIKRNLAKISYLLFDSQTPIVSSFTQLDEKDDIDMYQKTLEEIVKSIRLFAK